MEFSNNEIATNISNFRDQLHVISDTFFKLMPDQQSEAVKLIHGLHSSLLNQTGQCVSNSGVDFKTKSLQPEDELHLTELPCNSLQASTLLALLTRTSKLCKSPDLQSIKSVNCVGDAVQLLSGSPVHDESCGVWTQGSTPDILQGTALVYDIGSTGDLAPSQGGENLIEMSNCGVMLKNPVTVNEIPATMQLNCSVTTRHSSEDGAKSTDRSGHKDANCTFSLDNRQIKVDPQKEVLLSQSTSAEGCGNSLPEEEKPNMSSSSGVDVSIKGAVACNSENGHQHVNSHSKCGSKTVNHKVAVKRKNVKHGKTRQKAEAAEGRHHKLAVSKNLEEVITTISSRGRVVKRKRVTLSSELSSGGNPNSKTKLRAKRGKKPGAGLPYFSNGKNLKVPLQCLGSEKGALVPVSSKPNIRSSGSDEGTTMRCSLCSGNLEGTNIFKSHECKEKVTGTLESHVCRSCGLTFSQQQHLQKHLQGHQRNNCRVCNAQFTKRKALCKHMRLIHKIAEPEKLYQCSHCERRFYKRPSLYAHLREHADGKIVCTKCGCMSETDDAHRLHMKRHVENANFHCDGCGESFVRRQQYNQHMTGHQRHVCPTCSTNFSTKKLLIKHRQTVHGIQVKEEKKHECDICNKKFQRPTLLYVHRRIHTGERPIQCSHCDKSFRTHKALTKHMKTASHIRHVGEKEGKNVELEKPFLCSQCGAKFYRRQGLLRHAQQLHTEAKPYECPYCNYKCKCKTNLKRHIELHTNRRRFVCELCGSAFHAFATLKEHHAYVHSDIRSFICEQCGKGFKGRSGLKRHLRIHSDARPYICHCGQSYKRMSHLKRHMASSHHVRFKSKRVKRIHPEDTSDGESTTSSETQSQLQLSTDGLRDSCQGLTVLLTHGETFPHHLRMDSSRALSSADPNGHRAKLPSVDSVSDEFILVSPLRLSTFSDKPDQLHAIVTDETVDLEKEADSLVSLLSPQNTLTAKSVPQADMVTSMPAVHDLNHSSVSHPQFQNICSSLQATISPPHSLSSLTENDLPPLLVCSLSPETTPSDSTHPARNHVDLISDSLAMAEETQPTGLSTQQSNHPLPPSLSQLPSFSLSSLAKFSHHNLEAKNHVPVDDQEDLPASSVDASAATTAIWVATSGQADTHLASQPPVVIAKVTTVAASPLQSTTSDVAASSLTLASSGINLPSFCYRPVPAMDASRPVYIFSNEDCNHPSAESVGVPQQSILPPPLYAESVSQFLSI